MIPSHGLTSISFLLQWLGFDVPDPRNDHYRAIVASGRALMSKCEAKEEDLYFWIDYVSIPQKNQEMQKMSIASLATYASIVDIFVIIAPTCIHNNTGLVCNATTYRARGWCRLEQWARMTTGGLKNIYKFDGEHTTEDSSVVPVGNLTEWLRDAIDVMGGTFTYKEDKHKIVDIILGLWVSSLEAMQSRVVSDERRREAQAIIDYINEHKERVFPPAYFGGLVEVVEQLIDARGPSLSRSLIDPVRLHASLIRVLVLVL